LPSEVPKLLNHNTSTVLLFIGREIIIGFALTVFERGLGRDSELVLIVISITGVKLSPFSKPPKAIVCVTGLAL
jgi:hypothetical protein